MKLKDLKSHFIKEEILMANKHAKMLNIISNKEVN